MKVFSTKITDCRCLIYNAAQLAMGAALELIADAFHYIWHVTQKVRAFTGLHGCSTLWQDAPNFSGMSNELHVNL